MFDATTHVCSRQPSSICSTTFRLSFLSVSSKMPVEMRLQAFLASFTGRKTSGALRAMMRKVCREVEIDGSAGKCIDEQSPVVPKHRESYLFRSSIVNCTFNPRIIFSYSSKESPSAV